MEWCNHIGVLATKRLSGGAWVSVGSRSVSIELLCLATPSRPADSTAFFLADRVSRAVPAAICSALYLARRVSLSTSEVAGQFLR
jgi:hypothetical protein